MKENRWAYFGTKDPFKNGGAWMAKEEGNDSTFEFVKIEKAFDGHLLISHGNIDLESNFIDKPLISKKNHLTWGNSSEIAHAVLSFYGYHQFDPDTNYEDSESKIKSYLKGHGIQF